MNEESAITILDFDGFKFLEFWLGRSNFANWSNNGLGFLIFNALHMYVIQYFGMKIIGINLIPLFF